MTTWTPTSIVMHKLDLIPEDGKVVGNVVKNASGTKSYFHVVTTDTNGKVSNYYIDISDTAYMHDSTGQYFEYREKDESRASMLLNLYLVGSVEGAMPYTTKQQALSNYQTFKTALETHFAGIASRTIK